MFDAAWHDEQIAFHKLHRAVAEFDLELALEHEEEVVGVRMAVPDELALGLYHLDLVVVDRRDDARREALIEERELLREIDRFVHETGHASAHTPGPCAIGAVRPSRAGQAPARSSRFSRAHAKRRALLAYSTYLGHAQLVHATPQLLPSTKAAKNAYLNDVLVALTSPPERQPDPGYVALAPGIWTNPPRGRTRPEDRPCSPRWQERT